MEDIRSIQIPLLDAFTEIMKLESNQRCRGVDLSSYLLLIETLQKGYGLDSQKELIFICKKLWIKPFHSKDTSLNEKVLEEILTRRLEKVHDAPIVDNPPIVSPSEKITDDLQRGSDGAKPIDNPSPTKLSSETEAITETVSHTLTSNTIQTTGKLSLTLGESTETNAENADGDQHNNLFSKRPYVLEKRFLPVTPRFMEQTIKSLRYRVKGIGRPVIDVEATVQEAGQKGFVGEWQKSEEDGFITRWTLLLDHEGSMVAFHDMLDALTQSLHQSSFKNEGDVFYFHNYAKQYLFLNTLHTRSTFFRKFADGPARNILIVSDAGASRGFYNEDRIQNTYNMLYGLRGHRVAWLNPMPRRRWKNTSAEEIATFTSMFEADDHKSDNMGNIVQILKSKKIT